MRIEGLDCHCLKKLAVTDYFIDGIADQVKISIAYEVKVE